jgi:hypothetical protein
MFHLSQNPVSNRIIVDAKKDDCFAKIQTSFVHSSADEQHSLAALTEA